MTYREQLDKEWEEGMAKMRAHIEFLEETARFRQGLIDLCKRPDPMTGELPTRRGSALVCEKLSEVVLTV